MVTFRFYIVTTVALFLALAIGVVVGSALDERLVSGLESQVARVQGNLDDTIDSIDTKNREIEGLEQYVEGSAPFAVEGSLADTTLLVVAEDGVDSAPVESLVRRARQAGAHAGGIMWLDPRWHLTDLDDRETMADALGLDPASAATVRQAAWSALLTATAEHLTSTTTTDASSDPVGSTPDTAASDSTTSVPATASGDTGTSVAGLVDLFADPVFAALADIDFVRVERVDGDDPGSGGNLAVVFVTGQDSDFETPGDLFGELGQLSVDSGAPTVLAEVYRAPRSDEKYERGSTLIPWREGDPTSLSTVDDLDLTAGRVATILALADLRRGVSGHYGYGPGADRVLPEWLGP